MSISSNPDLDRVEEKEVENREGWEEVELASISQRLVNLILDTAFFYGFAAIVGSVLNSLGFEKVLQGWGAYGLSFGMMLAYYIPQEWISGKTLGKWVTSTQAINDDGRDLTLWRAILRTLCRFIPFEAFSFLMSDGKPRGWHDRLSKTLVITLRKTNRANAGNNTESSRRQWQ